MKNLINLVTPVKAFAAMIFTGIMILYMISGFLYDRFTENGFGYYIPFSFVLQGLVASLLISILWGIFLSSTFIKNWRFFSRLLGFKLSLVPLLGVSFFTVFAIPSEWSVLWFVGTVLVSMGLVLIAMVRETYFKRMGDQYTQALKKHIGV